MNSFAVRQPIEPRHLLEGERTRPDAAEDGDVVARLVHGTVAVEAAGDAERRRAGFAALADIAAATADATILSAVATSDARLASGGLWRIAAGAGTL